ncbi:unnamed protein product [Cylindrotheca closterium]|uniref:Uncharacterized protein n=1 Tax=Cylindrotheca closterium TaxID=2856 RepID=A0AAD2G227_9STRA|nr:unnamed protein product [Cylindrotheca closterium]
MGSDERNAKYRQQVLDLMNHKSNAALPSYPHVSMLDADAITKELMEELVAQKAMPEWLEYRATTINCFLLLQGIGMLGAFTFSSDMEVIRGLRGEGIWKQQMKREQKIVLLALLSLDWSNAQTLEAISLLSFCFISYGYSIEYAITSYRALIAS